MNLEKNHKKIIITLATLVSIATILSGYFWTQMAADNLAQTTINGKIAKANSLLSQLNLTLAQKNAQIANLTAIVTPTEKTIINQSAFTLTSGECLDVATVNTTSIGYLVIKFASTSPNILFVTAYGGNCQSPYKNQLFSTMFPSNISSTFKIPIAPTNSKIYLFVESYSQDGPVSMTLSVLEYTGLN